LTRVGQRALAALGKVRCLLVLSGVTASVVDEQDHLVLRAAERRLGVAALIIYFLTIASSGQRGLALVALFANVGLAIAYNMILTSLARPGGARALRIEWARALANTLVCAAFGHLAHWPLATFAWLPYQAFVVINNQHHPRARLAVFMVGFSALSVVDGCDPRIPFVFSVVSGLAYFMLDAHVASVRQVLEQAVTSRRALEQARRDAELALNLVSQQTRISKQMEIDLRQAQKLESVGRLASGIAHEINTPVQFIGDSLEFLAQGSAVQLALLKTYRAMLESDLGRDEVARALDVADEQADLGYLEQEVPKAFVRCQDGLSRVAGIVRAMKEFAHPDQRAVAPADLNRAVESTLIIAHNECKYVAELKTDYGPLPVVRCVIGEVNQALLNIVVNSAHAIADRYRGTEQRGLIAIRTYVDDGAAVVSVCDDGGGIPKAIRDRVFDPFFTTKEVGRGTGQGLAIARNVMVNRHNGALTFEVDEVKGTTTFYLRLPLGA
jgi:signal transduction histidine kinase